MLAPGRLDLLTMIPVNEIKTKGIPYVKSLLETTNKTAWANFWNYFEKTWLNTYGALSIFFSLTVIFLTIPFIQFFFSLINFRA